MSSAPAVKLNPFGHEHRPMQLTLPVALLLHGILIFGLSFTSTLGPSQKVPSVMDVTLVQMHTEKEPEEAKFIAQANQLASGSANIENNPRSPLVPTEPNTMGEKLTESVAAQLQIQELHKQQVLTTKGRSLLEADKTPEEQLQEDKPIAEEAQDTQEKISQLFAELDEAEARYAKRPTVLYLDSVSAKSAIEASYVDDWKRKIERIGTINFPDQVINSTKTKQLIVNTEIASTGRLLSVKIAQSSGNAVLDKAAVRIVKLAAPFPSFPPEIRKKYDQLDITRTLIFHGGQLSAE